MIRRRAVLPLAALATAAAVALPIAAGSAQSAPRTITAIAVGKEKMVFDDIAPRGLNRGRLSLGDRLVSSRNIRVDGKPGLFQTVSTITSRRPTTFSRFTALLHATVDLADGELFGTSYIDSANGGERSVIVGGTGRYRNATGTVANTKDGFVITLDPS
ncbi:MAG: hypothetical protein M3376_07515 [Actinomycetota bacterium]|nr:hypothetical protein [Actinomycetota bacterium]